ncbi:DUF4097 family beta strand repeat-containing protein [Lactobacillus johnsonii]|uniref:DUF4097 domain-containing protein n=1 Tax=Lactobacillus johnsonii TaxID=33959 RepID=A0A9W3SMY6_LACJH|nr:DUF4097 family beta strand repeat-containing protein [Lactobacillus johnsonii]AEB92601.1 hypothetical protein LJP_0264c [Lactobacillus johnsonii DPC 6026]AOG26665.1 hypothetical protein BBP16_07580 [Lactobacillus johnsonii]
MLFSLGLTLSACSIIITNNNNNKPAIKTTISNQGFNQLKVSAAITDISIKYGDKYNVEYEGPKNLKPTVSRKNGNMTIKQSASGVHHINGDPAITITVPKHLLKSLNLSTDDGDIEVENIATTNPISLNTDDGDIDINNLKSPSGRINTSDGDITISKLNSKNGFKINTDDGDIKVKGDSSSDTFTQNKNSANVLTASTQDGDIKIK